jgi:hypothetical protein
MKRFASLCVVALFCATASLYADDLLVNRGLPIANLNNAAGTDRSNVAWADYSPYDGQNWAMGDTFSVNAAGAYDVTDLTVWVIGTDSEPLSDMWSDLTLFGGGTTAASVQALSTVSTSAPDPNVVITPATYAGGLPYQGTYGSPIQLYQVSFLLNWMVTGDTTYSFFVGGTPTAENARLYSPYSVGPFLASSNAALSGSPQQGADGLMWEYAYGGSGASMDSFDTNGNGWDKSSDANVLVYGNPVPEASFYIFLLMNMGLLSLAFLARRKYQTANR